MYPSIAHRINPLHVYCRLVDAGFNRKTAGIITKIYERIQKTVRKWKEVFIMHW